MPLSSRPAVGSAAPWWALLDKLSRLPLPGPHAQSPLFPRGFRTWPHGHFLPTPVIFRCLPGIHPCEATLEQKHHSGVPSASPSAP